MTLWIPMLVTIEEIPWEYWHDPEYDIWIAHSPAVGQVADGDSEDAVKTHISVVMVSVMQQLDEAGVDVATWFRDRGLRVRLGATLPEDRSAERPDTPQPPQLPLRLTKRSTPDRNLATVAASIRSVSGDHLHTALEAAGCMSVPNRHRTFRTRDGDTQRRGYKTQAGESLDVPERANHNAMYAATLLEYTGASDNQRKRFWDSFGSGDARVRPSAPAPARRAPSGDGLATPFAPTGGQAP